MRVQLPLLPLASTVIDTAMTVRILGSVLGW
jgi:hypothetical protein